VIREAVKLKSEAFWASLSWGSPEAADSDQVAKRATELLDAKAKTQAWD